MLTYPHTLGSETAGHAPLCSAAPACRYYFSHVNLRGCSQALPFSPASPLSPPASLPSSLSLPPLPYLLTPSQPPFSITSLTPSLFIHVPRTQNPVSVWAQAITPGLALAFTSAQGCKSRAASPLFTHPHCQPFNHQFPVSKRSWPGGKIKISCRPRDLARLHHLPSRLTKLDSLLSYVDIFQHNILTVHLAFSP